MYRKQIACDISDQTRPKNRDAPPPTSAAIELRPGKTPLGTKACTFSSVLALCAGPWRPAPVPVELSPTGAASQDTVQLRGFSCDRPQSSEVLSCRKARSVTDAVLIKEAKLQVIQHVPRFEIPAYKCKLTRDLAISYGGFSSYPQHLPFGYYEQSDTLAGEAILGLQCTAELVLSLIHISEPTRPY